jgi:hypothetical protein
LLISSETNIRLLRAVTPIRRPWRKPVRATPTPCIAFREFRKPAVVCMTDHETKSSLEVNATPFSQRKHPKFGPSFLKTHLSPARPPKRDFTVGSFVSAATTAVDTTGTSSAVASVSVTDILKNGVERI